MLAGVLRGRIRDLLERAASGEAWCPDDECESCRQYGACVCFGQEQHGQPFSFLRIPSSICSEEKTDEAGSWSIQSYCELVFAVVCSWRHVGASDEESFRFNAMIATGLCMDLIPASPFPSHLSNLLLLMAGTRMKSDLNVSQASNSRCAFAKELHDVLEHIMQLSNEELRPWMQHCSSAILELQPAQQSSPGGSESAAHALETLCRKILQGRTDLLDDEDCLEELESLLHQAAEGDVWGGEEEEELCRGLLDVAVKARSSAWLWARVVKSFTEWRLAQAGAASRALVIMTELAARRGASVMAHGHGLRAGARGLGGKVPEGMGTLVDDTLAVLALFQESSTQQASPPLALSS